MSKHPKKQTITPELLRQAFLGSFRKLNPRYMMRNPVMFVVEVGFVITLILSFFPNLFGGDNQGLRLYNAIISVILFVTMLFANFAESVAEGRGKSQAASLKKTPEGHGGQCAPARRLHQGGGFRGSAEGRRGAGQGR